ncbi:MAG: outer membrane protein [Verrucomicrobiales bacterium]|jgi:outer membrane protein
MRTTWPWSFLRRRCFGHRTFNFINNITYIMNLSLKSLLSISLTLLMLAGASSAQTVKIGVVDMKRIFAEYARTKEAESEINDRKAQAKRELDERTATYKELLEKFQALQAQVQALQAQLQDEALSPQLREQKRDEGRDIGQQAKSLERQIQEFRTRRERQLQEQVVRMRKTILEEIRELVEEISKTQNYDMVFDKSGVHQSPQRSGQRDREERQ